MSAERLQKLLARSGVASRRAAEEMVQAGRVKVNGKVVTELGARADLATDRVEVDGRPIEREAFAYYVVNKPKGMVTTMSDPEGRPALNEILQKLPERVYPVGRLDFHTSGVLLVTNDGDLAQALLHPSKEVPKTYVAKLNDVVSDKALEMLRRGVTLDDGYKTAPASVTRLRDEEGHSWLELTITEGKNRQIHRMIEVTGFHVMRLSRVRFAGLSSEGLRPSEVRALEPLEIALLKRTYQGIHEAPPVRAPKAAGKHGEREGRAAGKHGDRESRAGGRSGERTSGSPFGEREARGGFAERAPRKGREGERRSGSASADREARGRSADREERSSGRGERKSSNPFAQREARGSHPFAEREARDDNPFAERDRRGGNPFADRQGRAGSAERDSRGGNQAGERAARGGKFGQREARSSGKHGDRERSGGKFGERSGGKFGQRSDARGERSGGKFGQRSDARGERDSKRADRGDARGERDGKRAKRSEGRQARESQRADTRGTRENKRAERADTRTARENQGSDRAQTRASRENASFKAKRPSPGTKPDNARRDAKRSSARTNAEKQRPEFDKGRKSSHKSRPT